jgi:hypothetical protein
MTIQKITTHIQDAQNRLVSEFQDKPNIASFLSAFTLQTQLDEDMLFQFMNAFMLRTAIGNQLDLIGEIVGQARRGRNDFEYRLAIFLQIAINTAKGTANGTIEIFTMVTGASNVHLLEYFPGVVEIYGNVNFEWALLGDGPDAFAMDGGIDGLGFGDVFDSSVGGPFAEIIFYDTAWIYFLMDRVLAGGVRLDRLGYYSDTPFSFEGDPRGLGFGDVFDSTVGGDFATIVLPS